MAKEKLVFRSDFDGVITNPEIGADAFRQVYTGIISGLIGLATHDFNRLMREAKDIVQAEPEKYGWVYEGKIVAPYYADHYIETKTYAYKALDMIRKSRLETRNLVPTFEETPEFLNQVFLAAHPHILAPFRDGALDFVEQMNSETNFGFVSNSETTNVRKRLVELFNNNPKKADAIKVVGDAKKQKLDSTYDAIKESMLLPGLSRRVYLRRKQYLTTLRKEKAGVVLGDVPELDLYAPIVAGMFGILLRTPRIRSYEYEFVKRHPHGRVVQSLEQAAQTVISLRS